jgi:subtilisin family serine protease
LPLIAVGLGPASVMAEGETTTTNLTLHNASGILGIGAGEKAHNKAAHDLLALHREYQAYLQQADAEARGPSGFRSRNFLAPTAAGYVSIDTAAAGDPEALAADLEALGLQGGAVFGRMVSGRLLISAIPALEALDSLKFARPAYARARAGAVTSQGDAAIRADVARNAFGADGTGVTVGVLSDSFNCRLGAATGVASGDLPAGIAVLEEGPCAEGLVDEGRALAEVVHDVAPGAAIAFHTAQGGQANFAQGIVDLANAGAKAITDDIIYLAEPMFQDGHVAQAVDQVKGLGVSYFSAAGNDGRKSYESPFRGSGQFIDLGGGPEEFHDFDPGAGVDTCQKITLAVREGVDVVFQWDQPFFSVSGAPGSQSDMDILFTDAACTTILRSGLELNGGGDPFESVSFQNGGPATSFGLIILRFSGPNPGLLKTVLLNNSQVTIHEFDTKSGTAWGHPNSQGGLGVGAVLYRQTPSFGTFPPLIESFSSAGGVPVLFDTSGNRLSAPQVRAQPAVTAPDGADTTFFGGSDPDATGFPNFFGTSAAAPHAAGVAALLKDLNPLVGPDDIYNVLKTSAIDMDYPATQALDAGFDFGTGFGLIQADGALSQLPALPVEVQPAASQVSCQGTRCRLHVTCILPQGLQEQCRNEVNLFVRARSVRLKCDTARAPRRIRMAGAVANVPPSQTMPITLKLTNRGRAVVRRNAGRKINGTLEIRNVAGTAISATRIRIKLR